MERVSEYLVFGVGDTLQQPLQNPQITHLRVWVDGEVVEEGLAHLCEYPTEAYRPTEGGRVRTNHITEVSHDPY